MPTNTTLVDCLGKGSPNPKHRLLIFHLVQKRWRDLSTTYVCNMAGHKPVLLARLDGTACKYMLLITLCLKIVMFSVISHLLDAHQLKDHVRGTFLDNTSDLCKHYGFKLLRGDSVSSSQRQFFSVVSMIWT